MTGPFSETDNCVGTPIKGDTCGVLIRFAPDQIGPVTGALAIDANVAGGRIVISLAGIGSPAGVWLLHRLAVLISALSPLVL